MPNHFGDPVLHPRKPPDLGRRGRPFPSTNHEFKHSSSTPSTRPHPLPQSLPVANHAARGSIRAGFLRPLFREQEEGRRLSEAGQSQVSQRAVCHHGHGALDRLVRQDHPLKPTTINNERKSPQHERNINRTTNRTHHLVLPRGFKRQGVSGIHRTPRRRVCRQLRLWSQRIDHEHRHQNPNAGGLRHGDKIIYDKLVHEKKAKGYTEGPDGTPVSEHRQRRIVSPVSCLNCSTRLTNRKSSGCSKIRPWACRRSSMAAVFWSVRLELKSTASIARAC